MSKMGRADWREWMRDKAEDQVDDYVEAGGKITYLPTIRKLHCKVCQHQGTVSHPAGRNPTFRCKRCGNKL